MLDIRLVRDNPDAVRAGLRAKKSDPAAVDALLEMDAERRRLTTETEELKRRKNELSKEIPVKAKAGEDIEPLKAESREIGAKMGEGEARLKAINAEQSDLLLRLPNLPHESTPLGTSEADNKIVRTWGEKPTFDFQPKTHWDLGKDLGILDLERGAKISGSGFIVLKGAAARLERALAAWMLDIHTRRNGYTEIAPPYLVSRTTMTGTGQLPKMEEDMYHVTEEDMFLIPTAEVPVTNLHAGEILDASAVPTRYVALSPCFRREAGSYGKEVRGITRIHQFNKVEMVQFTAPEKSYEAHEELTSHATGLLEALGLHYRVALLCSGDISFAAAKCYDLEVWAPGMGLWLEVSSCSNFEDFQARRANIRFRREAGAKPEFVHTLNGSGLALPRLLIALLETYQQADGSIALPPVLHAWAGTERIGP
ncbi:MAG: seryl-tRNA synthetase [Candidatus Sumerlaeota bacterium]|nr:seryl-tRNA synthetase [Candidatus Sumerlaeota bacterium]